MLLPTPDFLPGDRPAAVEWVSTQLSGLWSGPARYSREFVGGQGAAAQRLAAFDVTGYAKRRNEVWPTDRQGASRLSPYIRHGLLSLPLVWRHVAAGPPRDVTKFRDELLWQEYARHLYARMGSATAQPLRYHPPIGRSQVVPNDADMACWQWLIEQLEADGWLPNQARMWFASHWAVRRGWQWQEGEEYFFRHLLDGSRAANRLGWQWTIGSGTGKPYGFSRWQVNKRAPGMCDSCALKSDCPIEDWPDVNDPAPVVPRPELRAATGSPWKVSDTKVTRTSNVPGESSARVQQVWITAESLGDDDPAMSAHPETPVVFVFDAPLLRRLQLASQRLVFLVECLADLAHRKDVEVRLGSPSDELRARRLAVTYTPVPGWRRIADRVRPEAVHPWPWLAPPHDGPLNSFSAWRKRVRPNP